MDVEALDIFGKIQVKSLRDTQDGNFFFIICYRCLYMFGLPPVMTKICLSYENMQSYPQTSDDKNQSLLWKYAKLPTNSFYTYKQWAAIS